MIDHVILTSKQRKSDLNSKVDEEYNVKKKGIINEYFKADKSQYSSQFSPQNHS